MNLNHEIVYFQDIDIKNSILCMRMMLKSENLIKKYKIREMKLNELLLKTKQKKVLFFPYNSKLTFCYIITDDKNTISTFIKNAQDNRNEKKPKSIFEQNEDEDENCQEESENSDEIKNSDNSNNNAINSAKNKNNEKVGKIGNKNYNSNDHEVKKFDFRQKMSIFEKSGHINKSMTCNEIKPPSSLDFKTKNNTEGNLKVAQTIKSNKNNFDNIINNINKNLKNNNINDNNKTVFNKKDESIIKKPENIKKDVNQKTTENKTKFNEILKKMDKENKNAPIKKEGTESEKENLKKAENNIFKNNIQTNQDKNEPKKKEESENKKENLKKIENNISKNNTQINQTKNGPNKKEEPESKKENFNKIERNKNKNNIDTNQNKINSKNESNFSKIEAPKKTIDINKSVVIQKSDKLKNSGFQKATLSKDDTDLKKGESNSKSRFMLKKKTINITNYLEEDIVNLDSFCNCFFICSFPYNNGKVMENGKNYRSLCNHAICCKLLAMEPEIIYKYPLEDEDNLNNDFELNSLSASICFPIGIKICYNQDRRSIYKSFSTHVINKEGKKYYMTIYHFYRQLDSMTYNKLYTDEPLKIYLRQFGDNVYKNKSEKEQLEKDLEECQELAFREYSYVPYALALVSKYPYINQMRSCLNIIYKILTNHDDILNNLKNEEKSSLLNKLLAYLIYGIPIPNYHTEISFNMPLTLTKIKIQSPYNNNIRNLEYVNFSYIISRFCPETIIKIYRLMIFEHKLLFIDKDNNRLSTVISSFINILYPIEWVNTIIPIMSDQMTRYLQTFLPFVTGISEDLLSNSAGKALKEAEEGIFQIYILNDTIKYSKPNYEDEVWNSVPKLPNHIFKKLYSELSDLIKAYKLLTDKEKEKYTENINNIAKNIFLETVCIMLYGLIDYTTNTEKGYNGFNPRFLIKMFGNDANFYKDLTETQIFQNFIQNFLKKKKDYSTFISMMKNITEKYVKTSEKYKIKWKNIIRTLEKKDIQQIPLIFKIPIHLLNKEDTFTTNYTIDKPEWNAINKTLQNSQNSSSFLSDEIIQESDRIASTMIPIKTENNIPNDKIERFYLPGEEQDNFVNESRSRMTISSYNNPDKFEKLLQLNYVMANEYIIREESDIPKEEQDKIKKSFKQIMTKILKNEIAPIDLCLKNVYYSFGRDMLCKSMYQKGFKVVKKLKNESFNSLKQICINAFVSLNNLEENQSILEFAVKITSSAFCYCLDGKNIFLIDELSNNLGKDYSLWNKKTFWNTWQALENYFSINDYGIYCQVIVHDFINKLLKLKLDKEFIENYLISTIAEKMILLDHNSELSKNTIKENQQLFMENRTIIMDFISNYEY